MSAERLRELRDRVVAEVGRQDREKEQLLQTLWTVQGWFLKYLDYGAAHVSYGPIARHREPGWQWQWERSVHSGLRYDGTELSFAALMPIVPNPKREAYLEWTATKILLDEGELRFVITASNICHVFDPSDKPETLSDFFDKIIATIPKTAGVYSQEYEPEETEIAYAV